jgi:hypothetical protein
MNLILLQEDSSTMTKAIRDDDRWKRRASKLVPFCIADYDTPAVSIVGKD